MIEKTLPISINKIIQATRLKDALNNYIEENFPNQNVVYYEHGYKVINCGCEISQEALDVTTNLPKLYKRTYESCMDNIKDKTNILNKPYVEVSCIFHIHDEYQEGHDMYRVCFNMNIKT